MIDENTDAAPLPIVQYWHDGSPPDYIEELFSTLRAHNPRSPHRVFDQASAEEFLDERLGERELAAFRSCLVPAMQADYFRYCAAFAMPGVYCDADVLCVGDMSVVSAGDAEGTLFLRPHGAVVNGLFAFRSPGHPLLALTLELVTANIEGRRWDEVYMCTGPAVWTAMYWLHQAGSLEVLTGADIGPRRKRYVRACCEAIGSYGRLTDAFARVRVEPAAVAAACLRFDGMRLPYKETDLHWANFDGTIYRDPSPP